MKYTKLIKITAIVLFAISPSCNKNDHGHDHPEGEDHSDHDDHSNHDDHDHDHSKCGVVVGPNGGRMIEDTAELNLTPEGQITLVFAKAPAAGTEVTLLLNGTDKLDLNQIGKNYSSATYVTKFPADLHVKIKNGDDIHVETVVLKQGNCAECKNSELACTCENHDHDEDGNHIESKDKDHHKEDDHGHGHGHDHDHDH